MTMNQRVVALFTGMIFLIGILLCVSYFSGLSETAAVEVAKTLHCTDFQSVDPGQAGSIDSGHCFMYGRRYTINTFPSPEVRDNWLAAATALGVRPAFVTSTSVTYPSVY